MYKEKQIMDKDGMRRALTRIAHEIIEKNKGIADLALIGICRRGVPLAQKLAAEITAIEGRRPDIGIIDITLYRDDLTTLAQQPILHKTEIDFSVSNKKIVLVDDVIFTGRTARAALDAVIDLGRPRLIQLAVLVDRGHRELPIRPDYIGKNIPTSRQEIVSVCVEEIDGVDKVVLQQLSDGDAADEAE